MFSVHQHWDPLKVCAVGRSYPPEFYNHIKNSKVRNVMERIAIETEEDYQKLIAKLEEFGVTVVRTDISPVKEEYHISKDWYFAPPMTPRDHTAMIGNRFFMPSRDPKFDQEIEGLSKSIRNILKYNQTIPKEYEKYFNDLLLPGRGIEKFNNKKIKPQDLRGLVALLAHDENIKNLIHMANTNTIGSTKKFIYNNSVYAFDSIENILSENNVQIIYDNYINTATTIRVGIDLYFNFVNLIGKLNEKYYIDKLKKLFPEYRINILDVTGHSDGHLCAVKPGLLVGLMGNETYSSSFPEWEVVSLPGESWYKLTPFLDLKKKNRGKWWVQGEEYNQDLIDYIETWMTDWVTYVEESVFDVNMLVINENNIICNGYNEEVFKAFERHGITPHVINFRHRYFWDGGLHCITSDISREGEQKDYFPNRKGSDVIIHQTQ